MAPIRSSLSRSVSKLLGVFKDTDLSLRGNVQTSRSTRFDASGGTKITSGSDVYHVFTSDSPFVVTIGGQKKDMVIYSFWQVWNPAAFWSLEEFCTF